jgi:chemotaxis signal transduction protein
VASRKKNVIVFTTGEHSYAIELGWIREVFTLGHVTPVPLAPDSIAGVVNFRGSIISVLDLRTLTGASGEAAAFACQGESALLIEVDRNQVALRAGTIDEVSSLSMGASPGHLSDSRGRNVELLSPEELIATVLGVQSRTLSEAEAL